MILTQENKVYRLSGEFLGIINPFYSRINVIYLRMWQCFLKEKQTRIDEDYAKNLVNACKSYFNSKDFTLLEGTDRRWAEAVIYISLYYVAGSNTGIVWPAELYPDQEPVDTVESILITSVTGIYDAWKEEPKQYPCARAYAYCILIEALIGNTILRENRFEPASVLDGYLETADDKNATAVLDYLKWGFKGTGSDDTKNHLTNFIFDYASYQSPAAETVNDTYIEHCKSLELNTLEFKGKKQHEKPISIMLVGLTNNGKSYIITALNNAVLNAKYKKSPLIDVKLTKRSAKNTESRKEDNETQNQREPQDGERKKREQTDNYTATKRTGATGFNNLLEGKLKIGNNKYDLEVFDSRGAEILVLPTSNSEKEKRTDFEKALMRADLLLIVIDPETLTTCNEDDFDSKVTNSSSNALDFLFERDDQDSSEVRSQKLIESYHYKFIGIVFSKFDEYGVIMTGPRRLINSESQRKSLEEYIENAEWQTFKDSLVNHDEFRPEMKQTLSYLLSKTKGLLNNILVIREYPVVNIYLTTTETPKQTDFRTSGIPAILEDLCEYLNWLFNEAENPIGNLSGHPDKTSNQIILKWENTLGIRSNYKIKRRTNFSDFTERKSGFFEQSHKIMNYVDKPLEKGKIYTYNLELENGAGVFETSVATDPPPLNRVAAKIDTATDDSHNPVIELTWDESNCDYPVKYSVKRLWLNEPNQPQPSWKIMEPEISINKYIDYTVKRGGKYIYKVDVYKADDTSLKGEETPTETIRIGKLKIPWPLFIFLFIFLIVIYFLVRYLLSKPYLN